MVIELSREQFRTMILYHWKIGLNYRESHVRLVAAWGDQAPSDRTVLNWFHEYEHGKLDVSDSPRSGRPRTAVTDEMIDAVRLMIDDDPHVTYQQIDFSLGINSPAIYSILHDHFKATEGLRTMGHHIRSPMIKNDFEFNSVANH